MNIFFMKIKGNKRVIINLVIFFDALLIFVYNLLISIDGGNKSFSTALKNHDIPTSLLLSSTSAAQRREIKWGSSTITSHFDTWVHEWHRYGKPQILSIDVPRKYTLTNATALPFSQHVLVSLANTYKPVSVFPTTGHLQFESVQLRKNSFVVYNPVEDARHNINIANALTNHIHPQKGHHPESSYLAGKSDYQT